MIFALVLLYQTATAGAPAGPPKADTAQTMAQVQAPAASVAAAKKPSEKPDVVCRKEFPTGTRVRTVTVCTSAKSMENSQNDFVRSLSVAPLTPIP